MHIFVAIAVITGLIAYAFGQNVARVFVGIMLGLGAAALLLIVTIVILDSNRQQFSGATVHMEPQR